MGLVSNYISIKEYPDGMPDKNIFQMDSMEIKPAGTGEITVKNHYISVDPYMRGRMSGIKTYIDPFELGKPMEGGAVGEIIHSGDDRYRVGEFVLTMMGWRDMFTAPISVLEQGVLQKIDPSLIPIQSFLGVAGMPGLTAYAGLYKVAGFKPGETVLVSAASGAVGSVVVQLAALDGAKVIGIAGSDKACKWLESHGCDSAINYKTSENLAKSIKNVAPGGIDIYFENVGGKVLQAALENMKQYGRIAACGMIASYNNATQASSPSNLVHIVAKSLKMQGFIVVDYQDYALEYLGKIAPLMADGKLVAPETILHGLDKAPEAFLRLFDGNKFGKILVKIQ